MRVCLFFCFVFSGSQKHLAIIVMAGECLSHCLAYFMAVIKVQNQPTKKLIS